MASSRLRVSPFVVRLGAIALVALVWRLIYIPLELPLAKLTDEYWYIGMAKNLFTPSRWTSLFPPAGPTAQHGPLTSILLSPVAWIFPHASTGLRYVMAFVGTGTVIMMGLAGRAARSDNVGLVAAGLTAIIPDFWIRDGLVVSEPIATLIVAVVVYLAIKYRRGITPWVAASLGALTGVVALARPEIAPVLAVITIVMVLRHSNGRTVLNAVLAILAVLVLVGPWTIYNQGRFSRTVLLSNNLGITLAGANCPQTYYSWSYIGYDTSICWNRAGAAAAKVSSDESVQSAYMRHLGLAYAFHHADRLPLVAVMRVAWFLGVRRPAWVVGMGMWGGQPRWATWSQAWSFYFVFPAAMIVWWLNRRRQWPHWIFGLLVANSFLVVIVFVGHWRYRVTLDVAMVLILALGAGRWLDRDDAEENEPTADDEHELVEATASV